MHIGNATSLNQVVLSMKVVMNYLGKIEPLQQETGLVSYLSKGECISQTVYTNWDRKPNI